MKFHSQKQGDIMVASVKVEIQGRVFQWKGRGPSKRSAVLAACKQAIILVLYNIHIVLVLISLPLSSCSSLCPRPRLYPYPFIINENRRSDPVGAPALEIFRKQRHKKEQSVNMYVTIVNYIKVSKKHNDWFIY